MRGLLLVFAAALLLRAQPEPQRFTLPNGLRVILLEEHARPLVRIQIHLPLDLANLSTSRLGLAPLALRVIERSDAGGLKAGEVDQTLARAGIQMSRALRGGGLEWRMLARSRDQDQAMGVLANRLLRTILDPRFLELERQDLWREELRKQATPRLALHASLTGDSAQRLTWAEVSAISFADLRAFQASVFRPDRAVLVLHGDLGLEQAKALVRLNLGTWTAQADPPRSLPAPESSPTSVGPAPLPPAAPRNAEARTLAPLPAGLSPEALALLSLLIPGDPLLAPAQAALGDQCLVVTFRAEAGGSTGASEARAGGTRASGVVAGAKLQERLEALRRRGFTQADLDLAREAWRARRSLNTLHPEALMDATLFEALGQAVQPERMKALNLDALNEGLRRWLDPSNLRSG